jgi:hypothetical protein
LNSLLASQDAAVHHEGLYLRDLLEEAIRAAASWITEQDAKTGFGIVDTMYTVIWKPL